MSAPSFSSIPGVQWSAEALNGLGTLRVLLVTPRANGPTHHVLTLNHCPIGSHDEAAPLIRLAVQEWCPLEAVLP